MIDVGVGSDLRTRTHGKTLFWACGISKGDFVYFRSTNKADILEVFGQHPTLHWPDGRSRVPGWKFEKSIQIVLVPFWVPFLALAGWIYIRELRIRERAGESA